MEKRVFLLSFIFFLLFCLALNNAIPQLLTGCSESDSANESCKNSDESPKTFSEPLPNVKRTPEGDLNVGRTPEGDLNVGGTPENDLNVGGTPEGDLIVRITPEGDLNVDHRDQNLTEEEALLFLQRIDEEDAKDKNINNLISWNFETNVTDYNKQKVIENAIKRQEFLKDIWNRVQVWKSKWPTFKNESLKRQFKFRSILGTSALPKHKFEMLTTISSNMKETYSTGKICDFFNSSRCNLALEPEIEKIMRTSRNYDELKYVWKAWRDTVGRPVRCQYSDLVKLLNEAATYNGFETCADDWLFDYESNSFEDDMELIYKQLHPLYKQLHAYTRRKLREVYGEDKISKNGPIPAHVTGNMWAQSWVNIYDLLVPFPNKKSIDVSDEMVQQGYTPKLMFEKADDFFASLGLGRVPETFWNRSVLEKPIGRDLVCHASAWDFYDGKDFRIKQCTLVNMKQFSTVHHELGHVQYYIQYKHLPSIFRRGANPGFHEAIGDIMDLSVSTPKHLQKIGLLKTYEIDAEADINFLLQTALRKVAFLPFGYLIDKYRWDIFRGRITPQNYTKAWWKYRYEYQGIEPPVERTELDFDPAAKAHISTSTRYIRYFASHILQFQFHKAACLLAKEYDPNDPTKPLHRCDIYQSKEAGQALKEMMSLGRSKHWSEPLRILTGSEKIDASALREYFLPLEKWLTANNEEHGEYAGWDGYEIWLRKNENAGKELNSSNSSTDSEDLTSATTLLGIQNHTEENKFSESNGQLFMKEFNEKRSQFDRNFKKAYWNYNTNLTEYNKKIFSDIQIGKRIFEKEEWKSLQEWKEFWPKFKNETLKRQFKLNSVVGTQILQKNKYDELNTIQLTLGELYSKGKICAYQNFTKCDLSLEPDLIDIFRRSRNSAELEYVWKAWRNAAGKPSRCLFTKMVNLLNEAASPLGFPSSAELWISEYESETFENDVERLFNQLKPLYQQIHSYTRRKLREVYGESIIPTKGPIPAHLTGDMWAQSWVNIYDLIVPYPNKTSLNVTEAMINQSYTAKLMFQNGDNFFASLGLERVPESFWNKSILVKPEDREMACQATTWDFSDGKDYRIKQCTRVTMEDLLKAYHELGHIQYFLQYKHLPYVFRAGANNAFHEAVADLIGLSVSTPKYLRTLGLLSNYQEDEETDINFLLKMSLDKIVFLPYGYLIDKYRWDIFRGQINSSNYTKAWWDYRLRFQGVNPPVPISEFDFDPAAKFQVSANVRYIRSFVAKILEFQFYRELCLKAREYDPNDPAKPLFKCNLYQSTEAGNALKQIMEVGKSLNWSEVLKTLTGSEKMDASAIREYFRPLEEWLRLDNERHGEFIGWD